MICFFRFPLDMQMKWRFHPFSHYSIELLIHDDTQFNTFNIQMSNIFGFGIDCSFDRQRYTSIGMRCKIHEHGRFDGDFKSDKFVLHAF